MALLLLLLLAGAIARPQPLHAADARIIPAGSAVSGKTYAEWSAALWKWLLELPVTRTVTRGGTTVKVTNPLRTPSGGSIFEVTEGQTGTVWFLAPAIDSPSTERTITIPSGTTLFVSLLNVLVSDYGDGTALFPVPTTYDDRLASARAAVDPIVILSFKIDGTDVGDLSGFRVVSPQFTAKLPDNSLLGPLDGLNINPTVTAIADGYYVLVKPLSSGGHTIEFSAKWAASNPAADVTVRYHILVQ